MLLQLAHDIVYLAVQEHLLLLNFVLGDESRLADCLLVVVVSSSPSELVLLVGLLVRTVLHFAVGLAIDDHLLPRVILLEDVHDVFVVEVLHRTWVHKGAMLQAVVFAQLLVSF